MPDSCVICEAITENISTHLDLIHLNNEEFGEDWQCYDLFEFAEGIRIMAPRGVNLDELSKCDKCDCVFYNHRINNHRCREIGSIYEGAGPEYCLVCQYRCQDVETHRCIVHFNNWTYRTRSILGIKTLLPAFTSDKEYVFNQSCQSECCVKIVYRNRIMGLCLNTKNLNK